MLFRSCVDVLVLLMVSYMQENIRSELERHDKERHDDFMSMLRGFVVNQVPSFYIGNVFLDDNNATYNI